MLRTRWKWLVLIVGVSGLLLWPIVSLAQTPPPVAVDRFHEQLWTGDVQPSPEALKRLATQPPFGALTLSNSWAWAVYQSYRDGNWEIYLTHSGQEFRLTNNGASDTRPRLNHGATQVVFSSNRDGNYEIYRMNIDGSGVTRLTNNAASDTAPAWSPDGTRLAFMSNRDGNYEIYVMNADGSGLRRLTYNVSQHDVTPTWSPDGTRLAFVNEQGSNGAIFVINADGSGQHQVLSGQPYLADVIWSPIGDVFAFDYIPSPRSYPAAGIYLFNTNGTDSIRYFANSGNYWVDYWAGSWSPDATNIMYTRAEYVLVGNSVYLNAAYIEYTAGSYRSRPSWTGLDMLPDWQTADLLPPVSNVQPLPPFSRAAGFEVTWKGSDAGPAGVETYDIQTRIGSSATWATWKANEYGTVGQYSGTPGQTVAFRSRARDYAGNLEDWSATNAADALTTLYTWQISGTVQDIRGYRVPSATLNFAPKSVVPITSSQQGTFEGYLTGWSQHTITATRPGYASSPDYRRVIETDRSIGVQVLSPLDNQIAQSGFEGGSLNSWQAGGDTAYVGVTSDTSNSGLAAAQLGQPAAFLYAVPDELDAGQLLDLASDARQYTYLFSQIVVTPAYQLRVMIKPITDTWPITSSVLLTATEPFLAVSFAPDRLGGLHVLSVVSGTTAVTHCYLPPHGPLCASPEIALPAVGLDRSMPQIAVDVSNTLHLVWVDDTVTRTLRYAQRPDGGAWSAPEAILDNASTAYLGVDDSRTVHVISSNKNNQGAGSALLFRKTMGARWSAAEAAGDTYHGLQYRFAVTGDGTEHVVWYDSGSGLHYQMKHPGQPWSDFLAISDVQEYSTTPTYLGVSAGGVVHVVYRGCMWGECIAYKVKPPASATFFHPADNFAVYNAGRAVTLDALGVIHLAWQPASDPIIHHTQTLVANGPSEYSVSQRVTIPAQAHRATVSLVEHSEPTWQLGNNRLAIEFSTGLTSTTVLSTATGSIEWSSHWADVNAWAGETITVSVVVHQAAGSPYQQAFVDDVMLGSWLTPVLTDLSQTQWDAWSPQTITLTGYNFISMPMVYLGNTVITDVDYLDEATLVAHLPAQPPGPLSMQVVNPGSQSSLPRLARVGLQTYLPVINK